MTQYVINIGALPNDGTGDPLRTAFNEVNLNFDQVFAAGPVLSNIQIANNTILTTNTNGNLVLATNGIGKIQAAADIVPSVSMARNLGSSDFKWNTVYSQYITISGDATIAGNLSVAGNIIQVGNIVTDALTIQLANTAGTANAANGAGITVGANDNIATFLYNSTANVWNLNIGLTTGNLILTDDRIMDLSGPSITNADLISGSTSGLDIVPNGDANATVLYNTYGNIQLQTSNTGSNVKVFNFTTNGALLAPGAISAAGNVTGNYIFGNGSQLTGINVSTNSISNGTSNVAIATANGPVTVKAGAQNPWTFGTDGTLAAPNESQIVPAGNNFNIYTNGLNGAVQFFTDVTGNNHNWSFDGYGYTNLPFAQGYTDTAVIATNGAGNIMLQAGAGPTQNFLFDSTGNLSIPQNINFNGGGIQQTPDENLYIRASDAENDGWSLYTVVDDGAGNDLARTQLQSDRFRIQTDLQGASYNWSFENGQLNLPGNINGIYGGNTSFYAYDNGGGGMVEMKTISYIGDALLSNVTVGNTNVNISTSSAAHTWTFDNTGKLTLPSYATIVSPNGTAGAAGSDINITAGSADQGDYYTTPGGDVNITAGLGAFNDGGGGGPGGNINIVSGNSADPSGHAGNINISSGSYDWTFAYNGAIKLPGGTSLISSSANNILIWSDTAQTNGVVLYDGGVDIYGTNDVAIYADNGNLTWTFDNSGTLLAPGAISAVGNITGSYIIGNGSQLTGLPAGYSNANASSFLANFGSNSISTTGTVTFGNTYINGEVSTTGNVTGANVIGYSFYANGIISASGNVDAKEFHGSLFGNTVSNITITPDTHLQFNVGTIANVVYINDGGMIVDGGVNGFISASGNISSSNVNAVNDIYGGNIHTAGKVSAAGAIFGANAIIDNTVFANIVGANIHTGNIVSVGGNIHTNTWVVANYIGSYGNIRIYNGNLIVQDGYVSANGNVIGANLNTTGNIVTDWLNVGNIGNIAVLAANALLQITTNAASNTAPYWTFNTDGNFIVPGAITGDNNGPLLIDGNGFGEGFISLPATAFGGEQIAIVNQFSLGNGIRLQTNGGNLFFDNDGDLSVTGNISTTGNVTAGNLSVTGNVVGNIAFTGGDILINNATGNGGSDEGGELHFAAATANSTLSGPIAIDIYQNKMRFFETEGNTFGMFIDIANSMGVAGSSLGVPAIGYRDVPQISLSANVTANVTNAGKHFYSTTAGNITLTIPDNANVAFPTGATLTIVMNAAGNVIVAQGTGVSLYMAGSSTTGNRVVGAYGLASVMKVATNTWVISGTGVY